MEKFMDILEKKMVPIAIKLDNNRYVSAIKDSFISVISLLIVGSVFLLIANLPISGYPEFMESILGENWKTYFTVANDVTMNIMTIYVIIAMAKSLADIYKMDNISVISSVLAAFFMLTPMVEFEEGALGIPVSNLGASGLFLGIITAVFAVELQRYIEGKGWTIKMPESVPENVSRSFSSLIPLFIIIAFFNIIRILFSLTGYQTAQNFIYTILQLPLLNLGNTLGAMLIAELFEQGLWSFGIHGSSIVSGIMQPIWLTLTAENAAAFNAGESIPYIINYQFYSNFIKIGGAGGTLGLVLVMTFFAKSKQYKALGKLAVGPGIFNINEPIIFGIPVVLNPIMLIPFIITPLVLASVAYVSMSIGLVPYTNGTNLPWTTPPIIAGLLLSGWRGALLNIVQIFISAGIYYPFFKIVDRMAWKNEQEMEQEIEI
ncbi:PTS sugar transporter subunit IIC [Garciella nitratireducens]|uniref:Permease IIC component n=1 Tax=Garciella nitratireducens DSM 15102 TaxID=1121911 RepID=A0A1T4M0R3_9FIRM|nr:PTS sugar transporter subunit IIC [Garciella nitratireducens]SJZ60486.1 PTS system, cellobiose-specific IIC component [Garciella nitratireducens DSM 15102]